MNPTSATTTTNAVTGTFSLNIFPARFTDTAAHVWVGLWRDPEYAAKLAVATPGLVTWRDPSDASRMYVWHVTEAISPDGFHEVTVTAAENPQLFQRLLDDAIHA